MPYNSPHKVAARANQLKSDLICYLGGHCAECGATGELEINHIFQRTWKPCKLTHYRRVLRYWQEAKRGLVNLLCPDCNKRYRPLPLNAMPTTPLVQPVSDLHPF